MFELVNKKRNNLQKNKKGFTLVEVIVVLVILAILAAILVPTMIGWINKANKKTAVVEARNVELAAQAYVSEHYSTYTNGGTIETANTAAMNDIQALSEAEGTIGNISVGNGGAISSFRYEDSTGKYIVTYDASKTGEEKYEISDK